MFKLEDIDELYDKFVGKEKRFIINGIEYCLISNEIGTMLIRSDVYYEALDKKIKEEIKNYDERK